MAKDDKQRLCSGLSYCVVGIVWYLFDDKMRKSDIPQFHARQAFTFLIAALLAGAALRVINPVLEIIPIIGNPIQLVLDAAIGATLLVLWILGIIWGLSGKKKKLPFVGKYAEKLKF